MRQLIEGHRIEAAGETRFNFADGGKVKQLHVDEATAGGLGRGRMGIVCFGDGYALVPREAAKRSLPATPTV